MSFTCIPKNITAFKSARLTGAIAWVRNLVRRHIIETFALSLFIVSCSGTNASKVPEASSEVRAIVQSGPIIGYKADNGANVWRGIPYAAAPVGDLRWRAPRPVNAWTEDRPAVEHPAWCPQMTTSLDELYGIDAGQLLGNEDCLFLSVYAPSNLKANQKAPVMFWVHGGSNVWGRAEEYDGSVLAQQYGVVVVIVQYRLGPLGFFTQSSLRETAKEPLDKATNFAVLDLVEALKWVKENADAFGGNPNEITIFGESAGAQNVYALTVSPLSKDLFKRAVAESGNPRSLPLAWAEQGHAGITNPYNEVAVEMTGQQSPSAAALRDLTTEEVFAPYFGKNGREDTPTMISDGISIPQDGIIANLATTLTERNIPLIMGSNRDEAKYLLAFNPMLTKKRFGVFPEAKDPDYYDAMSEYLSNSWRAITVNAPARTLANANVDNVYSYRFDWDNQGNFWVSDMSYLIGASHMVEIPFVFGTFDNFLGKFGKMMFNKGNHDDREALSNEIMAYWSNFAHEGKPGAGKSATLWPQLSSEGPLQTFVFDTPIETAMGIQQDTTNIEDILASLRSDPRLDIEGRRCFVASTLDQIFGLEEPRFTALKMEVC